MPWKCLVKYLLLIASSIRCAGPFTSIAGHNSFIIRESIRNLIFRINLESKTFLSSLLNVFAKSSLLYVCQASKYVSKHDQHIFEKNQQISF